MTQVYNRLILTAGARRAALSDAGRLILSLDAVALGRRVAALAMIGQRSALGLALWPIFPAVLGVAILHAASASCVLNPAIESPAISLGWSGHAAGAANGAVRSATRSLRVESESAVSPLRACALPGSL